MSNTGNNQSGAVASSWLTLIGKIVGGAAFATLIAYWLGINNTAPTAVIQAVEFPGCKEEDEANKTIEVFAGTELKFEATDSRDNHDGDKLKMTWKLEDDDGGLLDQSEGNMTYGTDSLQAGTYMLRLFVEDTKGASDNNYCRIISKEFVEPDIKDGISVTESWWRPWSSEEGTPPQGAFVGYEEAFDYKGGNKIGEDPLFLCRAEDQGIWKPGKVVGSGPCYVSRYVPKGGTVDQNSRQSIPYNDYEVFVPQGPTRWAASFEKIDPETVVYADINNKDESGVCRTEYGQDVENTGEYREGKHPGQRDQSINRCIFPWDDVAGFLDIDDKNTYDILVTDFNDLPH